jgi:hypothetical protein
LTPFPPLSASPKQETLSLRAAGMPPRDAEQSKPEAPLTLTESLCRSHLRGLEPSLARLRVVSCGMKDTPVRRYRFSATRVSCLVSCMVASLPFRDMESEFRGIPDVWLWSRLVIIRRWSGEEVHRYTQEAARCRKSYVLLTQCNACKAISPKKLKHWRRLVELSGQSWRVNHVRRP